jgi:uncharacterized protein (TIGR03790 family)
VILHRVLSYDVKNVKPFAVAVFAVASAASLAHAQTGEHVAVVINDASPASKQIAEHYIRVRSVPPDNVIRINATTDETIDRATYLSTIEQPIATAITRGGLHDRILYIVLTKGVPLRIAGTPGHQGTVASVDSELTLLYRRMTGRTVPSSGRVPNPYYLGTTPIREARPFTHREHDIFLVSRLDAFTVDEAIALIDRAQSPSLEGRIVLDERAALRGDGTGDKWLREAATRLREANLGDRVVLEQTMRPARDLEGVLGYYSWGSNDPALGVRRYNLRFVPGALAATFVSTDGRTFQEPPAAWTPSNIWDNSQAFFAGSPQSLIGDLIREGVTGVAGQVAEPYLQSTVRPDILFPAYVAEFNLIESFYLALPHLSWQAIVIGDPLCAPSTRKPLTTADMTEPVDAATELPGLFARRRLEAAVSGAKGASPKAISLTLLAGTRLTRGDAPGATRALEEATVIEPTLMNSQYQLATLYEHAADYAAAVARYRTIIELQPNSAAALNNLAYTLAVHQHRPAEGLPFAKKAASLAPENPSILDTLGWIEHLLGNHQTAAKILAQAVRLDPTIAVLRLHSAIVYDTLGARIDAERELNEAVRLNPELDKSDEVIQLRKRWNSGRPQPPHADSRRVQKDTLAVLEHVAVPASHTL